MAKPRLCLDKKLNTRTLGFLSDNGRREQKGAQNDLTIEMTHVLSFGEDISSSLVPHLGFERGTWAFHAFPFLYWK